MIGLLVFCFGQSYSQTLLQIYGGDKLGSNPLCINMLRLYCVYVLLLAVNGVTESLFSASMSEKQLQTHNSRLVLFSSVFLFSAFFFAKLFHIYGFLIANCINMSIRIYFSMRHIKALFAGFCVGREEFVAHDQVYDAYKSYVPHAAVIGVLASSLFLTLLSHHVLALPMLLHLIVGALAFFATIATIYFKETKLAKFVIKFIKQKN